MTVPVWLTFLVSGFVFLWGAYRLKIAFRSKADQDKAEATNRGLYALPRRSHFLFGLIYLLMGVFLFASGMGWIVSPFQ